MSASDKTILDPVHKIIPFSDSNTDKLLLRLINTPEFQRLRRIRQLGMTPLVFPGANHTRFAHSIGVMNNARHFLRRLERLTEITEDHETIVLSAALLHDLGHGPFSHAFEKITNEDHEKRTIEIICDDSTHVHQTLKEFGVEPDRVAMFFDEGVDDDGLEKAGIPSFLSQVVSSQMDADRFDYLIRDSISTGTKYGQFDQPWILQNLLLDEDKKRFYLNQKAMLTAESYVFARYHMYRIVYFHKTTRAAEVMLRLIFKRYKQLIDDADTPEKRRAVVADAPKSVVRAFENKGMSLGEYLALDEYSMNEFFKACCTSSDKVLAGLGCGLHNRYLFKAVDCTDVSSEKVAEFVGKATERVKAEGHEDGFAFECDSPSDVPYKPYDPDAEQPATQIYVDTIASGIKELGSQSEPVAQLKKQYSLIRYYFPEAVREDILKVAKETF